MTDPRIFWATQALSGIEENNTGIPIVTLSDNEKVICISPSWNFEQIIGVGVLDTVNMPSGVFDD